MSKTSNHPTAADPKDEGLTLSELPGPWGALRAALLGADAAGKLAASIPSGATMAVMTAQA